MNFKTKRTKSYISLVLCAGLMGVPVVALTASTASALVQLGGGSGSVEQQFSVIDPNRETSLTIHKYSGLPIAPAEDYCVLNNGNLLGADCAPDASRVVEGVTFKITRVNLPGTNVNVDLSTNEGWNQANVYSNNIPLAANNLDTSTEVITTTNQLGTAFATGLDVGLYYVEEVSAPQEYTKASPFLVTLPVTSQASLDHWIYDVHVYPKNPSDSITKTVKDRSSALSVPTELENPSLLSHSAEYILEASIPDGLTGSEIGAYRIVDNLIYPATGQEFHFSNVTLVNPDDELDSIYLSFNTHYIKTIDEAAGTATFEFTVAGLELLANNSEKMVRVAVIVELGDYPDTDDNRVKNRAFLMPSVRWESQNPDSPGIVSNTVESIFGHRFIDKVDNIDTSIKLEGAQFAVYKDANHDGECTRNETTLGNKLGVTKTTSVPGRYVIDGLQVSDFYNNESSSDLTTYCLVETRAPVGYNLRAQPIAFQVMNSTDSGPASDDDVNNPAGGVVVVKNQKTNLSNTLPDTGGEGAQGLAAGLGGLLFIVSGYAFISRKREFTS